MSRGHQRKTCFGGSLATADPLVAELAAHAERAHPVASLLYDVSQPQVVNDAVPGEDIADLDEQLLIAACERGPQATERAGASKADAIGVTSPAQATILDLMRSVGLSTVADLRTANLQSLRAAIRLVSEEEAAELWAALHVLLGVALRLHSLRESSHHRGQALIEASRAFDIAFSVYATIRASALDALASVHANIGVQAVMTESGESVSVQTTTHRRDPSRPSAPCANERDGTALIARVVAGPIGANSRLLERAVVCLRVTRAAADTKSWAWISATNNLAYALTLLGSRSASSAGTAMLREAMHVLHEALKAHAAGVRREDRALTLINLAETLLSIAERETPQMRLKKIERAYTASSMALLTVLPVELAWLVRLEHRDLE